MPEFDLIAKQLAAMQMQIADLQRQSGIVAGAIERMQETSAQCMANCGIQDAEKRLDAIEKSVVRLTTITQLFVAGATLLAGGAWTLFLDRI